MTLHPGKKLLFMGCEFGQWHEWRDDAALDWFLLDDPRHRQLLELNRELNRLYATSAQLHGSDCDLEGFAWIEADNAAESVFAFERRPSGADRAPPLVCIFNATPVPREDYWIGVGAPGRYTSCSTRTPSASAAPDSAAAATAEAVPGGAHGRPFALRLALPPLGALVFRPD